MEKLKHISLSIHLLIHFISGIFAGLITFFIWKQLIVSLSAGITGAFLIDCDHLFDYFLVFGTKFNLRYFLKHYQFLLCEKLYIPLHGFEFVILLFFGTFIVQNIVFKSILLAFAIGLLIHLISDVWMNDIPFKSYWLIVRIINNYEAKALVSTKRYQLHLEEKKRLIL